MTSSTLIERITIPESVDCPSWCSVEHDLSPATLASAGYIDHEHTVVDEPGLLVVVNQADTLATTAHPSPRFDLPDRSAHRQPPVVSFNVEHSGSGSHDASEVSVERVLALRDALTTALVLVED